MKGKSYKKRWIVFGIFFTIILSIIFSLNIILGSILRHYVDSNLETINNNSHKELNVGKIKFNLLERSLTLRDLSIVPDSSMFEQLKHDELERVSIIKIDIPILKLKKVGLLRLLTERNLTLNNILVRGVEFTVYRNETVNSKVNKEDEESNISIDSIQIAGLNSIALNNMEFEQFRYTIINVNKKDTIVSFHGGNFEIRGLHFFKTNSTGDFFRINAENLSLNMQQQRIDLRNANYFISLGELGFSVDNSMIVATDFNVKPTVDKYKLGASYKYAKEVFEVKIKSINFSGYKLGKAFRQGVIDIDSVLIAGIKVDIYKDITKPFDIYKRPLLMHQQLKALKHPLHFKNLRIKDGYFNFALLSAVSDDLMTVDINNIEANIDFITSIKDSMLLDKNLQINLKGTLMGASSLNVDINMPYNSPVDSFYFSGELGSGDFSKFNPALYPATGIKFNGGRLKSLKFYANASPKFATGLMTLLYNDLDAEVYKKDTDKEKKLLSFAANTVLRTSNPSKRGKTRVALIKTDRVEYKGFGNLLWKSVQSGLINTILPTRKSYIEEKQFKKDEKKTSSEKLKKKRKSSKL